MNCNSFCTNRRGDIWYYFTKPKYDRSNLPCLTLGLYMNLLKGTNTEIEITIEKDLTRTFPGVEEFKLPIESGENRLYNVLKAYANYDPQVSYCQGMNYIAAMLLTHISNEELAFLVFTHLMRAKRWRELYLESMIKLHSLLQLLAKELKRRLPEVYSHLLKLGMELNGLFSHIFLTGFIYRTPINLATRIFDLFIIGHEKVLIATLINMLRIMQHKILSFDSMVMVGESSRMCINI